MAPTCVTGAATPRGTRGVCGVGESLGGGPSRGDAAQGHDWHLQVAVATTGEGLPEGFDWIAQRLTGEAAPPRRAMPRGT